MDRKEAIEVIKKNWPDSSRTMLREALETLIPDLKENEDYEEKVRKNCIHFLKLQKSNHTAILEIEDCIAWLEKQGEQKSVWSEEDEEMLKGCLLDLQFLIGYRKSNKELYQNEIDWLKSLKSKNQWKPSEEQIKAFEHFVRSIGESGYASPYDNNTKLIYSLLNDLKKL